MVVGGGTWPETEQRRPTFPSCRMAESGPGGVPHAQRVPGLCPTRRSAGRVTTRSDASTGTTRAARRRHLASLPWGTLNTNAFIDSRRIGAAVVTVISEETLDVSMAWTIDVPEHEWRAANPHIG